MLLFHKMHGLGNDFVVLDSDQPLVELHPHIIQQLADRRTGIGFDQLLRLSDDEQQSFKVDIVNADGSQAEQCGNGMRAIAHLLRQQGRLAKPVRLTTTGAVVMVGAAADSDDLYVDLDAPQILPNITEVNTIAGNNWTHLTPVLVGNPHLVVLCDDPERYRQQDGAELASLQSPNMLEYAAGPLAEGCNAGFAKVTGDHIELCVWERGSGPTRACGSGACAAAWVVMQQQGLRHVIVEQPGGRLVLEWMTETSIRMTGPASYVYQGEIAWPTQTESLA